MIAIQNNKYYVINDLCQQCGSCVAICNKDAVKYIRDERTGLLNLSIQYDKCINCGLCENICPANKDTSISNIESYCQSKTYYLGHSKELLIRKNASSGGIARTIIIEGLRCGIFDGVYTLIKTDKYPFAEGYFYTKDNIPNYGDISNSIYHSVPLNLDMRRIQKCEKLLIVGTPCQLLSLSQFAKNKCHQLFSLCIFCKQQKNFLSTKFIARLAGIELKSFNTVRSYSYRGNGWPGYCTFDDKKVFWGVAALLPFGQKLWSVPGCDICGNPFGVADISLMDPWNIHKKNDYGSNVVIVHNTYGESILNLLKDYIELTPLSYKEVKSTLMLDDIESKNKLISFYQKRENKLKLQFIGKLHKYQRRILEIIFLNIPKMPLMFYRILNKLIFNFRKLI